MTNSNEAIAAATEILEAAQQIPYQGTKHFIETRASIIQKHYAAKDAEIKHLRQELALAKIPTTVDAVEREEWRQERVGLEQERDQLKARVESLQAIIDSASNIGYGKAVTQEIERLQASRDTRLHNLQK